MRAWRKIILAFIIFGFQTLACKKEQNKTEKLIEEGVKYIELGDFINASQKFGEVVKTSPQDPKARFGLALAQTAIFFKNVEKVMIEIGNIVAQLIGGLSPKIQQKKLGEAEAVSSGSETTLNDLLAYILEGNLLGPIKIILENLEVARKDPTWSLQITSLIWEVKFQDKVLWNVDMAGDYDAGDANFLYAGFSFAEAFLKIMLSIDIHLDLRNLTRINEYISNLGGFSSLETNPRSIILNVLPFILNERETFLGLEPKRGIKYWTDEIPKAFINMADGVITAYRMLASETDPQDDDIIMVVGKTQDGKIREIAFPSSSTFFANKELSEEKNRMLASIEIPPPDLEVYFLELKDSFEHGKPIEWGKLVEASLFFILLIVKTGAFDFIIESLLSSTGTAGLPEQALKNILQLVDPAILAGIIKGIIPDEIKFNFKDFFSQTIGLRNILPAWTEKNELLLEWECLTEPSDINPLGESNPLFIFFCKLPQRSYCFEIAKGGSCDINVEVCQEPVISQDDVKCQLYCPKSGPSACQLEIGDMQKDICIQLTQDRSRCIKYCTKTKIRRLISGQYEEKCEKILWYEDKEHFPIKANPGKGVRLPSTIEKDGVSSIFPYMGLQSPDFYGLIYINKKFLRNYLTTKGSPYANKIEGNDFSRPNQFEMNVFLQIVGENLQNIFSQFGVL